MLLPKTVARTASSFLFVGPSRIQSHPGRRKFRPVLFSLPPIPCDHRGSKERKTHFFLCNSPRIPSTHFRLFRSTEKTTKTQKSIFQANEIVLTIFFFTNNVFYSQVIQLSKSFIRINKNSIEKFNSPKNPLKKKSLA